MLIFLLLMKKILLIGCGHMGGSLISGWSNSKNYTISVIDKKKYSILKKRNRNKKIKFFKSIDDINTQNNFDYIYTSIFKFIGFCG